MRCLQVATPLRYWSMQTTTYCYGQKSVLLAADIKLLALSTIPVDVIYYEHRILNAKLLRESVSLIDCAKYRQHRPFSTSAWARRRESRERVAHTCILCIYWSRSRDFAKGRRLLCSPMLRSLFFARDRSWIQTASSANWCSAYTVIPDMRRTA